MKLLCLVLFFGGLCHGVSHASECTGRGRFPNNDAENCRGYTMCLLGGAAGFTQYKLTCPASFVYSHIEQQCTNATNYQCLLTYLCNVTGIFENPSSKNCSSYIACPQGISGVATARQVECPSGEVFNPVTGVCVASVLYICPASVTTTEMPVTTEIPLPIVTELTGDIPQNVSVAGDNGFHLEGSVSLNCAVDVYSKLTVILAILLFVIVN